ncbi:MAG: ATP-binding protein [Verrucomicrobiota bacterium]
MHLFFALGGLAVAWVAAAELSIMRAVTVPQSGRLMQMAHVPVALLVIALVGFVQLYFGTGRLWVGMAACALRAVCLIPNFAAPPNLTFREITGLRSFVFLGETITMPLGKPSYWLALAYLSSLFFLAFVIEASWRLWRKGTTDARRRAVVVGGGIVVFIVAAQGASILINAGLINFPFFVSIPFMAIIAAMGFELSYDVVRAAQLARALHESEDRMSLAAESARLSLWDWDIDRDEIWMTSEGRKLLGFSDGERISFDSFVRRVHPEDRASRAAAIRQALESGGSYEMEYRLLRPDGTLRWIAARGRAANGGPGPGKRLLGVSMDVTLEKQAAEEARQQQAELTHLGRVALMGEMAASLAHELNQPLTGIVNNASAGRRFIAGGRADFPKMDQLFAAVAADGKRAGEILRGIRGMVRKGEEERRPVEVGTVIHDTVSLAAADAVARHCSLMAEVEADLPKVEADAVQIQQVLLNLIINACEAMGHMPPDACRVTIEAGAGAGGPDRIRISVRDSGPGLPAENPQGIFERFFSTKRDGMGMGLAIARGIVTAHGGELTCHNIPGGGALFQFSLPVCREPQP